ncbi:ATP synthase F1 subunit epsilon [Rubrobacter tropicus]|uniref:ATP synthase epsilon chain n=1 Tax=Rubrobacter tropicus TaxID=2653851 RepID=A0A6G8Q9P6_9ACTN|nr:ATP synthase F1 subunit epsilon [Rubrobacter tropicus]QIN83205.1 ATP synthase F1 subunit epsilon [Rubrobacter tropicus]
MSEERQQGDGGRQLFCRIITPEKMVYDGEADLVVARIADGDVGVMVDHAPLVSTAEIGDVRIREGEELHVFATSDGFFKVSENLVQVLVEEAVAAEEIDTDAAGNQVEEAEREYSEVPEDEEDADRVRAEIDRKRKMGENLLRVSGRYGQG